MKLGQGIGMLRILSASTIGLVLGLTILFALHRLRGPHKLAENEVAPTRLATERKVDRTQNQQAPPRAAPPRFTPGPFLEDSSVTTDPRSPDYDPVKLSRLTNMSLGTAFDKEPRDPLWAPAREQMLKETNEADLASVHASARLLNVECKSATCKLVFVGKSLEESRWGSIIMQYTAAGNAIQPGKPRRKDGEVFSTVFVAYDAENRDPAVWARTHKKQREENLNRWRSKPVPPGYPPPPPN